MLHEKSEPLLCMYVKYENAVSYHALAQRLETSYSSFQFSLIHIKQDIKS